MRGNGETIRVGRTGVVLSQQASVAPLPELPPRTTLAAGVAAAKRARARVEKTDRRENMFEELARFARLQKRLKSGFAEE